MMTADGAAPHRLQVRLLLLRRPELGALAVIVIAWTTLIAVSIRNLLGSAAPNIGGMSNMPGMTMTGSAESHGDFLVTGAGLAGWILMCIAMMGPASLAGVRHTGINSLRWRRGRAMAEFSAAYLGVWAAFGIIALSLNAFVTVHRGLLLFASVLALAAAWQLTPFKRRALRGCHRSVPLPLRGWRAEKGTIWFGMRNGLSCVGSCWCLMLVMLVTPGYDLLWMIALTGIVTTERLGERPLRAAQFAANALWVVAAIVFAVAVNQGVLG